MRTQEEMVLAVHNRMSELQRRQETRRLTVAGSGCAALLAALVMMIARFGGLEGRLGRRFRGLRCEFPECGIRMLLHGLLPDDVGGYILVALAAFMAGAVMVVFIRAGRRKREQDQDKQE